MPEYDELKLDLPERKLNVLILNELLHRSENGTSLTQGLPEYIGAMLDAVHTHRFE